MSTLPPIGEQYSSSSEGVPRSGPKKISKRDMSVPQEETGKEQKALTGGAVNSVKNARSAASLETVKKVMYISTEALEAKLEAGDIFLNYYPTNSDGKKYFEAVAAGIRLGQKFAKIASSGKSEFSENFVHAALYVGNGQISEAVSDGIRLTRLDGARYKLDTGNTWGILVIRPKNSAMAKEASRIAQTLSAAEGSEANFKYSMAKALFSVVSGAELTDEALKRYLKGAAYAINKVQPVDKNGIRDFFCSYFVAWACQAGESMQVLNALNADLPDTEKIDIPGPKDLSPQKLDSWAIDVVERHGERLRKYVKLDLDPKYTTPQSFYHFVLDHPELFECKMLIIAPPKEIEMQSLGSPPPSTRG